MSMLPSKSSNNKKNGTNLQLKIIKTTIRMDLDYPPLLTLFRKNPTKDLKKLLKIAKKHKPM